jgi:aminoglycoside phosphotransferase (APT) family kinase protein
MLPLPDQSIDLLLIADRRTARWLSGHRTMMAELERLLRPDGLIYHEYAGPVNPLGRDGALGALTGDDAQHFWLTPLAGEMHTAVPLADQETIDYFRHHRLYSPSLDLQTVKRLGRTIRPQRAGKTGRSASASSRPAVARSSARRPRWRATAKRLGTQLLRTLDAAERTLGQQPLVGPLLQRHGVLHGRAAADLSTRPPHYVYQMAQAAGVSLDNFRWGLAARGDYSSRKLLFFLFDSGAMEAKAAPTYVVKMVRDPEFNARLENEDRALRLLQAHGIGDRETLPRVVFSGHHANLAIVGETAVEGVPFRQRSRATADCPYAGAAITWLTDLAAATADPSTAPGQVAATLEMLFARFTQIYTLAPDHHAFLADQIATIRHSRNPIPLVFQHGDPGTWNMMVTPGGRVALLDWEAAEPQGMPLWDLFYFLRSYAVGVARTQGVPNALAGFQQQLLAATPLRQRVVEATHHYCTQVRVVGDAVAPLFYTCWMHRALKEATRLQPAQLDRGHYVNLLRLCIDQRSSVCSLWSI